MLSGSPSNCTSSKNSSVLITSPTLANSIASSGKGYNGEDVDSIKMIGEPNITVEENE